MTIKTRQEELLWDIICLGGNKVHVKEMYKLKPEWTKNLVRGHLQDLLKRNLVKREMKGIYSLSVRREDFMFETFKEELEDSGIDLKEIMKEWHMKQ